MPSLQGGKDAQMQIALKGKLRFDRAPETVEELATLRQLKTALNRLGYYMPDPKTGMTHDLDANFTDALYAYQRKSTIMPDDVDIAPNSTTERMLNQDLAALDDTALYIWRTVAMKKCVAPTLCAMANAFHGQPRPMGAMLAKITTAAAGPNLWLPHTIHGSSG